eukprot:4596427-Pleurochrysis_carterae.AAC.1
MSWRSRLNKTCDGATEATRAAVGGAAGLGSGTKAAIRRGRCRSSLRGRSSWKYERWRDRRWRVEGVNLIETVEDGFIMIV